MTKHGGDAGGVLPHTIVNGEATGILSAFLFSYTFAQFLTNSDEFIVIVMVLTLGPAVE